MSNPRQTTIRIDKLQYDGLREISEETGISLAELVRRAIRQMYPDAERRAQSKPLPGQLSILFASADPEQ